MLASINKIVPQSIKNWYHFCQAIIAVNIYGHPANDLFIIGITGTDGKTTTSTYLYHMLKTAKKRVALISTVAAYIGQNQIDIGLHVTSPDPIKLQQLLKRIKDEGYEYVVLEATSHGLDQHRLFGTNIKVGVITNITKEHLDYHKTYDNYLNIKAKLFKGVEAAVLNQDDDSFEPLKESLNPTSTLIPYTLYQNSNLHQFIKGIVKETYNQSNALAAATVCQHLSIDEDTITTAISTFRGVTGRMESIKNIRKLNIVIDFAHTPNALEHALKSLKDPTHRLIAVFGAAGERDHFKRKDMGRIASEMADEVVLTAEDPRSEDVRLIIRQIKEGTVKNHGHIHSITDRAKAIDFAINSLAKPGDTVVILGKGHEQSMNLDGKTEIPYTDHQAVSQALNPQF